MSKFVWVSVIFYYDSQVSHKRNFHINKPPDYRAGGKLPALVIFCGPVRKYCTVFIFFGGRGDGFGAVMCFWIRNRIIIEEILLEGAKMYRFWHLSFSLNIYIDYYEFC